MLSITLQHYPKQNGVTFVELMISLFFVNVIVLLILGIMTVLLRSSEKTIDNSTGALAAGEILERYIYSNPSPSIGRMQGDMQSQAGNFDYCIDIQQVIPGVKKVDVEVYWQSNKREYQEGSGKLYTSITSFVRDEEEP